MSSGLCSAVARCQVRRLWAAAGAAPLPVAVGALLVVLAPFGLVRVGRAVGSDLGAAIAAPGVADALLLGPMLAAAVAGAAVAVSLAGRSGLGEQVGAAPVGAVSAVMAGMLVPGTIGAVAILPSLVALCVGVSHELPGGMPAGLALAVAVAAGLPAGAVVAECALALAAGRVRRSLLLVAAAVGWVSGGAVLGSPAAGPFARVTAALQGSGSPWLSLLVAAVVVGLLTGAWIVLAAVRPDRRRGRTWSSANVVPRGRAAMPGALIALHGRRAELRLAAAGSLGFGIAGTVVAALAAAPSPTPFLLATTTALLGSVVSSLAVCGLLLHGRWLWMGSPTRGATVGAAACAIGTAGTSFPVVAVGVGAGLATGATWNAVGVVALLVVVGSGVGLAAGALVPWSRAGLGDQLSSFTALAVVAVAMGFLVGLVAPRLVALGLPGPAVAVLVGLGSLAASGAAVSRRLRPAH